jgi:3',5'-cyclic AMP phosphodiesterase CpdA
MMTRRNFLTSSATAAVAAPALLQAATAPLIRIGLVADAQYADADPSLNRYYRDSITRLRAAVDHFNGLPLDFCVHVGDLIDRDWLSFDAILQPLLESRHQFHQLLGNHDFDVADEFKPRVAERLGMKQRYSWFDCGGFRFVILDTTEISTYAHPTGSPEHAAGLAELERLQTGNLPQAQPWNSGIGLGQLAWLDATCRDAGRAGLRVIVLAHHPLLPEGGYNVWNNHAVLDIIDRHHHVLGWFNGHHHAGAQAERNGVFFVTLHGMVDTAETSAYAVASLYPNRIELIGHGREPSRELLFRDRA